ncbi:acyl carrier protein [Algoriphagus sp.]|uniref:acyl carrier protein n=1 Tax=Algoriphagus sp. TaxID=1872435 RepID=UPI003297F2ED
MKNFTDLRKITKVFQQYGIDISGKGKYASFEKDLRMDKVFVSGLIFELEYELHRELEDDKVAGITTPTQVIELLMS